MKAQPPPSLPGERILVLTTSYPRVPGDAAGHFVKAEVDALRREGHDVTVAAPGGPFEDRSVVDLGGSELFAHPGALPRLKERPSRVINLLGATQKARRLARGAYDRVFCHWLLPTAYLWGTAVDAPHASLFAVAHGTDVRLLVRMPEKARNHVLLSLVRARFQLRFVADELRSSLLSVGLPAEIEDFVQGAEVRPSPIECGSALSKARARESLGMQGEEPWAVVVGRLIDEKRMGVALSAADLVPELKVAVIGSGPLRETLEAAHPHCIFLGQLPRDETLNWIAACDLLISTSRHEGAPTAIREARALGTQVISVPAGDVVNWAESDSGVWVVGHDGRSEKRAINWAKLQGLVRTSS